MNNKKSQHTIKPYVKEGLLKRLLPIIIIPTFMIIYSSFTDGDFDLGMFIWISFILSMIAYILYRFSFSKLYILENMFMYEGLTRKIKIEYIKIQNLYIYGYLLDNKKTYSLIVEEASPWNISSVERYRRSDIEFLISTILKNNTELVISREDFKNKLDTIPWVENEARKKK